jgi:hypothetical protein
VAEWLWVRSGGWWCVRGSCGSGVVRSQNERQGGVWVEVPETEPCETAMGDGM